VLNMKMKGGRAQALLSRQVGGQPVTPVMVRLRREDLETLDTLITAGIASSRAEAVRWALARIRERPAFEQLRARSGEIEALRSQF
jgi:Arc/MetJ-type ribon-helix-helix transcriptional regulator